MTSLSMNTVDLVFSFDTTGSMFTCIGQVRKSIESTVKYLFNHIPNLRVGIIAHGDYCDGNKVITMLDLSDKKESICKFIRTVPNTSGGDDDECYEFVLNQARTMSWTSGTNKALILIGDACPHEVGYTYGKVHNKLDWRNEVGLLIESGITVIPVQALGRRSSNGFYNEIATIAKSPKLELNQFADINDIIMAIAMSRAGKIAEFEQTLRKRGPISYSVLNTVESLSGKKVSKRKTNKNSLHAVHPSRFQILSVDNDCVIKDFVEDNGLIFAKGRGFYEFTKPVLVQAYKEVVIQHKDTGDMFSGDKAREIMGIPVGTTAKVRPEKLTEYRAFIQSTSNNRKLLGGTAFLYEVEHG